MEEVWKDIKGYEKLYQVSNLGRVKSLKTNKILKSNPTFSYKFVGLYKNKRCKLITIHRLVATTFIENPNNYNIINHIDGNVNNNNVSNLEWCTQKHNMQEWWRLRKEKENEIR